MNHVVRVKYTSKYNLNRTIQLEDNTPFISVVYCNEILVNPWLIELVLTESIYSGSRM